VVETQRIVNETSAELTECRLDKLRARDLSAGFPRGTESAKSDVCSWCLEMIEGMDHSSG
jgi:hypothetical protein